MPLLYIDNLQGYVGEMDFCIVSYECEKCIVTLLEQDTYQKKTLLEQDEVSSDFHSFLFGCHFVMLLYI